MDWQVRTGLVTGRAHILDERNCQDALSVLRVEYAGQQYIVGALADGCGSSAHAEVGAGLAVEFVTRALRRLLSESHALEKIPAVLYQRLIHFLRQVTDSLDIVGEVEEVEFVCNYLLFTMLGFVIGPDQTIVFVAGDGVVYLNDTALLYDQEGAPDFIGYHLLEAEMKRAGLPLAEGFAVRQLETAALKRLAIGSDGWRAMTPALDEVWGKKGPQGIQLLMNRWADERRFQDDASLIAVELIEDIAHLEELSNVEREHERPGEV